MAEEMSTSTTSSGAGGASGSSSGSSNAKNVASNLAGKGEDAAKQVAQTSQGMDAGDEKSNEVNSQLSSDFNNFLNTADQAKDLYNNAKDLRKNLNKLKQAKENGGAGKSDRIGLGDHVPTNTAGGDMAAQGASGGAKAGAEGAKAGGKAASTGAKAVGKAAVTAGKGIIDGIAALFATPVGWIILLIIAIVLVGILVFTYFQQQDDNAIKGGEYTTEYAGQKNEDIKNTWMGVFYQTYSDRSVWAQVDTTSIVKGDADICPDSKDGTYPTVVGGVTGVDACSGQSYNDLTGVQLKDIDTTQLYQEGTKKWSKLQIEDIGDKENYLALSAGTLSILDRNLNNKAYLYPEQFIKPVYASCIADVLNSTDKDTKTLNFDKCKLQNTDEKGKPKDIEPEDQRKAEGIDAFDDPSLYLTYAKSTGFNSVNILNNAKNVAELQKEAEKASDKDDDEEVKKEVLASYTPEDYHTSEHADDNNLIVVKSNSLINGQWDYGLGTLAHYKAVFQPSKVANYHVKKTEYVCDGNGNTSSGVKLDACAKAKFGDVVVDSSPSEDTLTKAYSMAYVPNSELYYRDWHPNAETYNNDTADQGATYYSDTSGEYPNMGIPKSQWKEEPGISTGIPQTEVKYVIDKAITMAGAITFNVSQKWVTQAPASHVQTIHTSVENKQLAKASEPFPDLGGANKNEVANYSITSSLYYKGSVAAGYQQNIPAGYKLTWVAPKTTIKQSNFSPETSKKNATAAGEYYTYKVDDTINGKTKTGYATVPAHYEDASGHVYWNGASHGLNTDNKVLSQVPEGENKDDYYWGAKVDADVTVEKEGDLQTYVAQYNSEQPAFTDQTNMAYLNQYLTHYKTYIPSASNSNVLSCYSSTAKKHSKEDVDDFQKMKDLRASTSLKKYKYNIAEGRVINDGIFDKYDEINDVCLAKDAAPAVKSLHLDKVPDGQFSSVAGRMGFNKDDAEKDENIVAVANKLKADVGQSTDSNLSKTLSSTDQMNNTVSDLVYTYSSQYGVDPTLLSLIIAEENAKNSNITGVKPGTYKAYNISSRARTTTEMGGGSKSKQKISILTAGINLWNKIKKIMNINQGGTVGQKGLETITVTKEQLENGAMLNAGSSTLQDVTDPSIFKNATITQDQMESAKKIYELLSSKGINDVGIAAMLGNAQQESGVRTYSVEPSDAHPEMNNTQIRDLEKQRVIQRGYNGIGLWQWTDLSPGSGRATSLLNAADAQGRDWKEIEFQVSYVFQEAKTYSKYQTVLDHMKTATDVNAATKDWLNNWEIGSDDKGALSNRQTYANQWAERIKNGELGSRSNSSDITADFTANTDTASIAKNIDNKDYHWDPSDPRFGTKPTESGQTLSSVFTDTDKKISTIVIYPMAKKGKDWYPGAIVSAGNGLPVRTALMVSNGTPYTQKDLSLKDSDIHTDWVQTSNGYSPMAIHLTDDLWIQSMPYTSKSRDSLRTNPVSYKHLIDKTPMKKENFYLQLKDVIYLATHADKNTKVVISSDPYTLPISDAVTEASEGTISTERERSQPSDVSGSLIQTFTPQALSTKVAAMQLQTLEVKYDYNIPMVITAYGMGSDFMDKVLDVYYQQTGIDQETAKENQSDTAWADYRYEVYNHPDKYKIKKPDSRSYDYAEKVLSRLGSANITYQRVDLRYDKDDDTVKKMTDIENKKNDSQQHTVGTWSVQNLYDSLARANSTLSGNSAARVARAMRMLNKESGKDYITANQWQYITNGQLQLPAVTYHYQNPSTYWDNNTIYTQLVNNISDSGTRESIISEMMRFGTDEEIGENDYSSSTYMQDLITRMFGNATNVWSGTTSLKELFGQDDGKDSEPITYAPPTKAGANMIRDFGYDTDAYGIRRYRPYNTYQDLTAKEVDVYGCLAGTVKFVDKNDDGYYVAIDIDNKKSTHQIQMQYTRLEKIFVNAGDKVTVSTVIGKTDKKGVYGVGLTVDNEPVNFETVRRQLSKQSNPVDAAPATSISSVKALEEYAKNWATNHVSDPIWAQCIAAAQGGTQGTRNFTLYKGGTTYQCTDFAHWVFWMQYGTDWSGGGNGSECVGNIVRTFTASGRRTKNGYYFTDSKTPTAGSIFSWGTGGVGHVGYVSKVEGDSIYICDGNVHGYNDHTPNYFYPQNTSGIRIDMKFTLSKWTGDHPDVHYAVPHK